MTPQFLQAKTPSPSNAQAEQAEQLVQVEQPRPALALDIAGGDLMLRGHFRDWESMLSLGPDLDHAGLRLAVDATSAGGGAGGQAPPLFSFRSRSVRSVGGGAFRAEGTLTGARGGRPLEMTVETPPGHTALFVLSFAADKEDFGRGWRDVIQNGISAGGGEDGEPVRLASAWLRAPVLAAA